MSEREDYSVIKIADQFDDMFLTHFIMKQGFAGHPSLICPL